MWLALRHELADWIMQSGFHRFMVNSPAAFTAAETVHFMGLSVLFGTLMVVDLRGLGLIKGLPLIEVHKLIPLAIGAFLVQVGTGLCFIFSNPNAYFYNLSFGLKMLLVLIAGVNAIAYELLVHRPLVAGRIEAENSLAARITCGLSLFLWSGVLIFGRLIPYV
jgi:hypothetical protein